MKQALALARLELREWRAVPIVALAAGFVPVLVWVAGLRGLGFRLVHHWLAHAGWNLAGLVAGAVIFTRELRERRSEFLLARPLSSSATWCGKLLAALTVTAGTAALCLLPGWPLPVLGAGPPQAAIDPTAVAAWFCGATLLIVGLGHWGALAFAAGGWRRLVDVAAVLALLFLGSREWERLAASGALPASPLSDLLAEAFVGAALMVAGAVQVWRGRADARRAYAVFSTTNWLALGLGVACVTCWGR